VDTSATLVLSDGSLIDGGISTAKYFNHSCSPNCVAETSGETTFIVRALKNVNLGDELLFNYGYGTDGHERRPCKCGAEECIGFIVSRQSWESVFNVPKPQLCPLKTEQQTMSTERCEKEKEKEKEQPATERKEKEDSPKPVDASEVQSKRNRRNKKARARRRARKNRVTVECGEQVETAKDLINNDRAPLRVTAAS